MATAAVLLALVVAAPARAKEPVEAKLCGGSGCTTITDRDELAYLTDIGPPTTRMPAPSAFLRFELTVEGDGAPETWRSYFVPAAGMIRAEVEGRAVWTTPDESTRRVLERAARLVEPFAKPTVSAVVIGSDRVVTGADTYLRLYELEATSPETTPTDWIPVDLRARVPSPWTAADADLFYSPSQNAIERAGQLVALDAALAADIEAGRSLGSGDEGLPVLPVLVLAAAALGIAGVAGLLAWTLGERPANAPATGPGTA